MNSKDQIYFFANWKMYLCVEESTALTEALVKEIKSADSGLQMAIFPSALAWRETQKIAGKDIPLGAQNGFWLDKGGYTGEVSMQMYALAGAKYVLVGHSERRHIFEETEEEVNKKMIAALEAGLIPVLCVGETASERDELQTEEVVARQLRSALNDLPEIKDMKIFVAYEPVWAIGTGRDCSPEDAGIVHKMIDDISHEILPTTDFVFLYGGSVNEENVAVHISDMHVDGVLVGGSSSKIDKARGIIGQISKFLNNI